MLPDITNYIPDPNSGRPIANGQVYFFIDGYTPPTNIADVNPAFIAEVTANGNPLPQPIYTTQGGVLRTGSLANMPPVSVAGNVKRVAVYDKCGKLVYSTAYNGVGAFVDADALAATDSSVLVGGVEAKIIAAKARANVVIEPSGGDDTNLLNNTASALSESGGGVIELTAGQYNINMIFGNGFKIPSNVFVVGKGDATVLKGITIPPSTNFVYVVSFQAVTNCGISHCRVDANKPEGDNDELQWHGIRLDGDCEFVYINHCLIENGKGDGVWCVKNPGFTNVPKNCFIQNNRFFGWNRQDIAIVEGDGIHMHFNYGTGVLDVEADTPNNKVNQNHIMVGNIFDIIRVSPLTGLNGVKNKIITSSNKCRVMSVWGANDCEFNNNIVDDNIELSQCGVISFTGGSCQRVTQNVTNNNFIQNLIIKGMVIRSETAAVGITLKDVVSATIEADIEMTAAGSKGIVQANNSSPSVGAIKIQNCNIKTVSHCIEVVALGLLNTTHIIKNSDLTSSAGRSITKDGAATSGAISIIGNTIRNQIVVRRSSQVIMKGNKYYDVANVNVDSNNAILGIFIDGERYFTQVPTYALSNNTVSGSIVLRDLAGYDVTIGSGKFLFTNTAATDVLFDGVVTSSDNPQSALTAPIRAGSVLRIIGNATKYGRWYNGSVWADLS